MTKEFKIGDEVWVKSIVTEENTIDFGNGWAIANPQKTEVIKFPPKPVLPKVVTEWLEECKRDGDSLLYALKCIDTKTNVFRWFYGNGSDDILKNQDLFARAWLDGYEVEQEKRYVVKLKPNNQRLIHYMEKGVEKAKFSITRREEVFTKPELEQAGFDWVFDCPGVVVKEVEDGSI